MKNSIYLKELAEKYELSVSSDKIYYIIDEHFKAGFIECYNLLKNKWIKRIKVLEQEIKLQNEIITTNKKVIRLLKKEIKIMRNK